jgi:hypothetical protein
VVESLYGALCNHKVVSADSQIWMASGMGNNVASKYFVDCKEYVIDKVAAKKL